VTEEQAGQIGVIDAIEHRQVSQISVPGQGAKPMGAAMSADGRTLYVTTGRGGSVVYVDTATASITRTIDDVGTRPWGIGVTPDGKKLYTANGPSNDVSVIDAASGRILSKVKAGSLPWGVAVAK
jgi:YVTN family beta-propeller protein